jgi:hypothetical protein
MSKWVDEWMGENAIPVPVGAFTHQRIHAYTFWGEFLLAFLLRFC